MSVIHMRSCQICRALISIHKFKAKINGPWDEAIPYIPSELVASAVRTQQE